MPDFTIEEFEKASRQNGVRFWEAHEFMQRLGYESWSAFQGVIAKAKLADEALAEHRAGRTQKLDPNRL